MTTLALGSIQARPLPLNWRRISALSGSFTAHIAIVLVLLVPPIALEWQRVARSHDDVPPIIVTLTPDTVPEPPLPVPTQALQRVKPTVSHPKPTITIDKPTPVANDAATLPIDSSKADDIAKVSTGPASSGTADSDGGPTTLGYGTHPPIPYPRISMMNREQGTVMLRVLVGVDGKVQTVEVERTSGSRTLDMAARDAVKTWLFKPGMRGGQPYAAWARVPINFTLP